MNQVLSRSESLNLSLPVTVISGFLGSGKTTLLNNIIRQQAGLKIAVLVNEFGEIGIDNELIMATDDNMIELNNGCICCTINENLVEAAYKIWHRRQAIDYLVVETTGVANLLPVITTFLGTDLREIMRLDSIITVVDCENFSLDPVQTSEAAISQILYSDILLLNKIDLVKASVVDSIEAKIRQMNPRGKMLRTVDAEVDLPLILSVGLFESDRYFQSDKTDHHHHEHDHHHESHHLDNDGFISVSFECEQPLNIRKFQYFIDNQLPENVFRGKGIIWFDISELRHIFHLSGKRSMIDDDVWQGKRKTQLVFIGKNLDQETMRSHLEACIATLL